MAQARRFRNDARHSITVSGLLPNSDVDLFDYQGMTIPVLRQIHTMAAFNSIRLLVWGWLPVSSHSCPAWCKRQAEATPRIAEADVSTWFEPWTWPLWPPWVGSCPLGPYPRFPSRRHRS